MCSRTDADDYRHSLVITEAGTNRLVVSHYVPNINDARFATLSTLVVEVDTAAGHAYEYTAHIRFDEAARSLFHQPSQVPHLLMLRRADTVRVYRVTGSDLAMDTQDSAVLIIRLVPTAEAYRSVGQGQDAGPDGKD